VTNTTPLIKLVGGGLLDPLPQLYGQVILPQQVLIEYQVGAQPTDPKLEAVPWIHIHPITVPQALLNELDAGEAAAITLVDALDVSIVLMDDRAGRRVAQERKLQVVGTLAVLLRAKAATLIPAVGPIIDVMLAQGRYISPALRAQVLRAADEAP
jgi:hypothetical protein